MCILTKEMKAKIEDYISTSPKTTTNKAKLLVELKDFYDDIEEKMEVLKADLVAENVNELLPDFSKKVVVSEGKEKTELDSAKVIKILEEKEMKKFIPALAKFSETSINTLNKEVAEEIIKAAKISNGRGDPYVSILKMTKEDFKKVEESKKN